MAEKDKTPRKQVTLPVAPDGWEYEVALKKGSDSITVGSGGEVTAEIDGDTQETKEADLGAGVRAAVAAARTLTQIETQRKALEDAQSKGIFGGTKNPPAGDGPSGEGKDDKVPPTPRSTPTGNGPGNDPDQPSLA